MTKIAKRRHVDARLVPGDLDDEPALRASDVDPARPGGGPDRYVRDGAAPADQGAAEIGEAASLLASTIQGEGDAGGETRDDPKGG